MIGEAGGFWGVGAAEGWGEAGLGGAGRVQGGWSGSLALVGTSMKFDRWGGQVSGHCGAEPWSVVGQVQGGFGWIQAAGEGCARKVMVGVGG